MLQLVAFAPRVESLTVIDDWICGTHASILGSPTLEQYGPVFERLFSALQNKRTDEAQRSVAAKAVLGYGVNCFEAGMATQRFLNLKPGLDHAAVFIKKFGVFAPGDLSLTDQNPPKAIRRWWKENAKTSKKGHGVFACRVGDLLWRRDRARTLLGVVTALKTEERGTAQKRAADLLFDGPEIAMHIELSRHISPTTVGLRVVGKTLVPSFYTYFVLAAVYGALWASFVTEERFRECARASCDRYFLPNPPSRRYCTSSCQKAAKAKRQRE